MHTVDLLHGKEERSKMRQNCVRNARSTFGGEHLLDDTEKKGCHSSPRLMNTSDWQLAMLLKTKAPVDLTTVSKTSCRLLLSSLSRFSIGSLRPPAPIKPVHLHVAQREKPQPTIETHRVHNRFISQGVARRSAA